MKECEKMQQEVYRRLEFDRTKLSKQNEKLKTAFYTHLVEDSEEYRGGLPAHNLRSFTLVECNQHMTS